MIHPPPDAFVRATELHRAQVESRETSPAVRALAWTAAGLLTLGLHVGLYLALTRHGETPPAPVDLPAAVMIDLSPEPTVAKSTTDNVSNEPEAPNSEQAEPEPEEEVPPDPEPIIELPPPPPQVKPQAVLPPAPPKEVKKPEKKPPEKKEEKKREKPVRKKDKPSVTMRAGGGPRSDVATGERTAASAAGSAISQASRASWQNAMRARIERFKRFPSNAFGAVGIPLVSVTFSGNGSVSGVHLTRSSGNAALDAEAVAVMYRAAPFPPPPGNQPITQAIPINFRRL